MAVALPRAAMEGRTPNFLHLGPGKSGSTWLHEVLLLHPQVFLTEAKDLYYFSRYYDRGLDWYCRQFRGSAPHHLVVGEVCPDYLACPEAPARIKESLGTRVTLMATLREPVSRAFSSFLYLRKHGLAPPSFIEAVRSIPQLTDEGRYATQLSRYAEWLGPGAVQVSLFDDLQKDPQAFFDTITDGLRLRRMTLEPHLLEAKLPASRARLLPVAMAVQRTAGWVRQHDGTELVGRIKRSPLVQQVLYKPLATGQSEMSSDAVDLIRERLAGEVAALERDHGLSVIDRWGWK